METNSLSVVESADIVPATPEQQVYYYQNASMLRLTEAEQNMLEEPIDSTLVEIRPDGLLYLPQTFTRLKLNKVFGIGQWCLLKKEVKLDAGASKCYYVGILHIRGCYVSEAVGEAEYHTSNSMQSWASVAESAKSDCIVRCCKDLGIASELWQPQFSKKWVEDNAVKVFVELDRNGSKKKSVQWRKKTDKPFWNETGIVPDNRPSSNSDNQPTTASSAATSNSAPKITDKQFNSACDRLKKGEHQVYALTLDSFTVTDQQKSELIKLYNLALKAQNA